MFEYIDNILCVSASWLYGEGEIMSKNNYDKLVQRKNLKKLNTGGNGRTAWVAFNSLPERFKDKITSQCDPYERTKHILFEDYITPDHYAENFFATYTVEGDEGEQTSIPEDRRKEYTHNAMILSACYFIATNVVVRKKFGNKQVWDNMANVVAQLPRHTYKHKLPTNPRDLKAKALAFKGVKTSKRYPVAGYEGLIHSGYLNKTAAKLTGIAAEWTLARWCNQVNKCASLTQLHAEYNDKATAEGWKLIKDEKTFYNYLYDEEIQPLWWGHRYGELAYKEKYGFQHKTKLPTMRDSLWYSDGTKLNYYYLDENGKMATCQVYEVIDAYSEVLLGYYIGPKEDYIAQYNAYKMAVQTAGYRPYQIAHDNQGGHKKLTSGDFLTKIAQVQTATKPYNGKSKTIESVFGRLQSQFLKRDWFFSGMNITTKKDESKANMEYILANQKSLPTLDEVKERYLQRRREWNEAPHPKTGKPRIQMYYESYNPDTKKVEMWDMISLFWITRKEPITCDASGISFTEKKQKYSYMVYRSDGLPDVDWLEKNIGKKFVVKFDPDNVDLIYLYEDTPLGLKMVTGAEIKKEVHRNIQEQDDFEAAYFKQVQSLTDEKRISRRDTTEELLEKFGMSAHQQGLSLPAVKGVESRRKNRKLTTADTFGSYQKALSNTIWDDEQWEALESTPITISNIL